MKKLSLLSLILIWTLSIHGQWNQQISGTTKELSEVYFLNQDTGFVVGQNSILKTQNGGSTWQLSYSGNIWFDGIYFSNSTNGFAVGYDFITNKSTLVKTINAGVNWTINDFTTTSHLNDIFFIDQNTGFIVGRDGVAFRTTDGGNSWDTLNTGATLSLQAVFFTSSQNGFIVGGDPLTSLILKTTDGGNSWTTINSSATDFLQGIFFPSSSMGYIVGWNGQILKSVDGGNNWIAQSAVANYGNLDVFFIDNNTGYVVGGDQSFTSIQKTTDGGQNWYAQNSSVNQGLIGVYFPTNSIGFAVGATGTILKTTNGGETGISLFDNSDITILTYPNPVVDNISIEFRSLSTQKLSCIIYDLKGTSVFKSDNIQAKNIIDISFLNCGIYVLLFKGDTYTMTKTILKR